MFTSENNKKYIKVGWTTEQYIVTRIKNLQYSTKCIQLKILFIAKVNHGCDLEKEIKQKFMANNLICKNLILDAVKGTKSTEICSYDDKTQIYDIFTQCCTYKKPNKICEYIKVSV